MQPNDATTFDAAWDSPVWNAENIAAELNIDTRRAYYMLTTGQIDATKVGDRWVSTRRRLLGKIARPEGEAA